MSLMTQATILERVTRFCTTSLSTVLTNAPGGLFGYTIIAAAYNAPSRIIDLLLQNGAKPDVRNSMGRSPIHMAAGRGGIENIQALLRAGADIKTTDGRDRTVLHWAATAGRASVVEMLLSGGQIDVDATDLDGWTPLCWAARGTESWLDDMNPGEPGDQLKVTSLLLKHGANQSVVVFLAIKNGHP